MVRIRMTFTLGTSSSMMLKIAKDMFTTEILFRRQMKRDSGNEKNERIFF